MMNAPDNNAGTTSVSNITIKEKLGQKLLKKGLISEDQLEIALTEQKKTKRLLGEILVSLGFVSESVMRDVLSQVLGIASVELGIKGTG